MTRPELVDELFLDKQWVKYLKDSDNINCAVMFSGGKDSALTLGILDRIGMNVEALHFVNKWTWSLSTSESKRICDILGIKLNIYDITEDFVSNVVGKVEGRPCTYCKSIMDRKTAEFCLTNDFRWIAEGDNAMDSSIKRIREYESKRGNPNLFISRYLDCVELGEELPESLEVIRPLIDMEPEYTEDLLLKAFGIKVNKTHEIGDKYEFYWREGCSLQYIESGTPLTEEVMDMVFDLNSKATDYAKQHGIRSSVYFPSRRIVTIPQGFEDDVRDYVEGYITEIG